VSFLGWIKSKLRPEKNGDRVEPEQSVKLEWPLISVTSKSSKKKTYIINMDERSCTCPDWVKTRSHYFRGEPQRLCKHLVKAIVDRGMDKEYGGIDSMIRWAAEKGWGFYFPKDREEFDPDESYIHTPEGRAQFIREVFGGDLTLKEEKLFAEAFGGVGYFYNLSMYLSRVENGPITLHEPPGGRYRWRLEMLTRTGIAKRGKEIDFVNLLGGLSMKQLREIGGALGEIKFRSKAEGCQKIAEAAGNVFDMWPSDIDFDDFFCLAPMSIKEIVQIGSRYQLQNS
jgi:hypothetical protein